MSVFYTHPNNRINEIPIGSFMQAARLLYPKRRCVSLLVKPSREVQFPYIEELIYNGGYTGDEYSRSNYYRLNDEVTSALVTWGVVEGIPQWGYTETRVLRFADRWPRWVVYRNGNIVHVEFA